MDILLGIVIGLLLAFAMFLSHAVYRSTFAPPRNSERQNTDRPEDLLDHQARRRQRRTMWGD